MSVYREPVETRKSNCVRHVANRVDLLLDGEVHRLSEAKVLKGTPSSVHLKRIHESLVSRKSFFVKLTCAGT